MKVCFNKKYTTVALYDSSNLPYKPHVGDLYPGEVFFLGENGEGSLWIKFRGANGQMQGAYYTASEAQKALNKDFIEDIIRSPYREDRINGEKVVTFKLRRKMAIYDINGEFWGYVSEGRKVAIIAENFSTPSQTGSSKKPYCLLCHYVQRNSDGEWIRIGKDHGFVDIGVDSIGSEATRVPLVGDWNR